MEWDDVKYLVSLSEHGDPKKVAKKYQVNYTTVYRRLLRLEEDLQGKIFNPQKGKWQLTAFGENLVQQAQVIRDEVYKFERMAENKSTSLSGTIRITTTDTLFNSVVKNSLLEIQHLYPEIKFDVDVGNEFLDLTKKEADVAIRPSISSHPDLIGKKIANLHFALYVSKKLYKKWGDKIEDYNFISPSDSLSHLKSYQWIKKNISPHRVRFKVNNLIIAEKLCQEDAGIAILPCHIGEENSQLVKISKGTKDLGTELWVLTHRDLKNSMRIRLFLDSVYQSLGEYKKLFELV